MTEPDDEREPEPRPVLQRFGDAGAGACDGDSCTIPEAPADEI